MKMKVKYILITATLLAFFNFSHNKKIFAAKKYSENMVTVDGVNVSYDNNVVNGGIDVSLEDDKNIVQSTPKNIKKQVSLNIPFKKQINSYYYGPAAAAMVINHVGNYKSQYDLANFLGDTHYDRGIGQELAKRLNEINVNKDIIFHWSWHKNSRIDIMKNNFIAALLDNNGVIVNTFEQPGDVYIYGHNIGTQFFNFGVVSGYDDYGANFTYLDPSTSLFYGFNSKQKVSLQSLSSAVDSRGYIW